MGDQSALLIAIHRESISRLAGQDRWIRQSVLLGSWFEDHGPPTGFVVLQRGWIFNAGDRSIPPKHHLMIDVQTDADPLPKGVVMMAGRQA